jgi:hypothetical protein
MPQDLRLPAILLLAALLGACASAGDPPAGGEGVPKPGAFLVIALAADRDLGAAFEDGMVEALRARGVEAQAAHRQIPGPRPLDGARVDAAVRRLGSDAALITRLRLRDATDVYHPPEVSARPGAYGDLSLCCGYRSLVVAKPGYKAKHLVLNVETSLFETESTRRIWSASGVQLDPASQEAAVRESVAAVSAQLRHAGWLP